MTASSSRTASCAEPVRLDAEGQSVIARRKRRVIEARVEHYKNVSIRLREAEYRQFALDVEALGLTSNMALRIAARRIAGFIEVDRDLRSDLEEMLRAVGAISQSLRDLHGAVAAGGMVTPEQLDEQRAAFGDAFARLDGMLRSILNVSRRRADGCALLKEAAR